MTPTLFDSCCLLPVYFVKNKRLSHVVVAGRLVGFYPGTAQ